LIGFFAKFLLAFCLAVPMIARPMAEPEAQEKEQDIDLWIRMQAWAETRRKQIGFGLAGVLVIGFAIYTNNHMQAAHRRDAETALLALTPAPDANGEIKPVAASEYLKITEEFAGTPASERALLLAAGTLFTENKYEAAEKRFKQFINEYPGSRHTDSARLGVAASQDAQNRIDQAIAGYERLIAASPGSSQANQAKIALALLHEQKGHPDQALKLYDELIRAEPQVVWSSEASLRRAELLKKHPNLTPSSPSTANDTGAALPATPTPLLVPQSNAPTATNAATTNTLTQAVNTLSNAVKPAAKATNPPAAK